jgi:hypothetical protein
MTDLWHVRWERYSPCRQRASAAVLHTHGQHTSSAGAHHITAGGPYQRSGMPWYSNHGLSAALPPGRLGSTCCSARTSGQGSVLRWAGRHTCMASVPIASSLVGLSGCSYVLTWKCRSACCASTGRYPCLGAKNCSNSAFDQQDGYRTAALGDTCCC